MMHVPNAVTPIYICLATVVAVVWDWLLSISEEWSVVHRTGFSLPTVTYFVSRLFTLAYCTLSLSFFVAPFSQCKAVVYANAVMWELAMPATTFLFLLRVRAIFHDSKPTRTFFGVFWVAVLGTSTLLILPVQFARRSSTGCVLTAHSHAFVASILPYVFDTFVFFAISWRIAFRTTNVGATLRARLECFFSGRGLKALPMTVLHGGQLYYLVTMIFGIICLACYINSPATEDLRYLFGPPYLAISNLMACHAFRDVMLCDTNDVEGRTVEMTTLHQEGVDSSIVSLTQNFNPPDNV